MERFDFGDCEVEAIIIDEDATYPYSCLQKRKQQLDKISEKAMDYLIKYPTFSLEDFLEWLNTKPNSFIKWSSGRDIQYLNKKRKKERSFSRWANSDRGVNDPTPEELEREYIPPRHYIYLPCVIDNHFYLYDLYPKE